MLPLDEIKCWVTGLRWWPKGRVIDNIDVVASRPPFHILLVSSAGKKFYLPLVSSHEKPEELPPDRVLAMDNAYYWEAEYHPGYLSFLESLEHIETLRLADAPLLKRIRHARPLTLGTSNALALHRADDAVFVVKGYRRIDNMNIEPQILEHLWEKGFRHIPMPYRIYRLHGKPVAVVMEHIQGVGDGGKPFYDAYMEYLRGGKGMRVGLAAALGTVTAELHIALNSETGGFFAPEPISNKDVETWAARIRRMYKEGIDNIERLSRDSPWLEKWLEIYSGLGNRVEDAVSVLDEYRGLVKGRIHQDLHMAQLIYSDERGFIITDFEGEPGREGEEKLVKEPLLRDVASLIRSFQYLTFFAYAEHVGRNVADTASRLLDGDPGALWRRRHVTALTAAYIFRIGRLSTRLLGLEPGEASRRLEMLLFPWIVERAVYEVYYESLYRPDFVPVPILGLRYIY